MKASIIKQANSFIITLIPESKQQEEELKEFGEATGRVHIINCRGFRYLSSDIEFLIQPMPSSD